MKEKTRAVVLHLQRCAEDKAVVTLYTEKRGVLAFLTKMSRRKHSGMHSTLLRVLNILDITYEFRPKSKLQKFDDIQVAIPFHSFPYDPIKGTVALFLGEVLYLSLRNEVKNEPLFQYLCYGLAWLDNCHRGTANFHLVFLLRMTRFLGFWPYEEEWFPGAYYDLRLCCYTKMQPAAGTFLHPEEAALLPVILRMDFLNMHLFAFNHTQRQQFLDAIMRYYHLHIPEFPEHKSAQILREVLG